jgi:ABC-2 type transport system ATP-binding protein
VLTLRDVTKSFGKVRALDRVTFECPRGQVVGLLGPNGAGKSTAIALAVGLAAPDAGSVTVKDANGEHPPASRRVRALLGLATQRLALYPGLTVKENLRFFARVNTPERQTDRDRERDIADALQKVGLADSAARRVAKLSEGTARRVNLAAALIHRPSIVLLDEPTAGLDPASRRDVHRVVMTLRAEGCAVVYTTHNMDEAERLCDRLLLLDRGRVVVNEDTDKLLGRFDAPLAGNPSDSAAPGARLERAFFQLTGDHGGSEP